MFPNRPGLTPIEGQSDRGIQTWLDQLLGVGLTRFTGDVIDAIVAAADDVWAQEDRLILDTPDLLLGLMREEVGIPRRAFAAFDVSMHDVRAAVRAGRVQKQGDLYASRQIELTLALSVFESAKLGHDLVDVGHVLLGMTSYSPGQAYRWIDVLTGGNALALRSLVLRLMEGRDDGSAGVGQTVRT